MKDGGDDLMELALSAGAEDMQNTGKFYEITSEPADYEGLKKALQEKGIPIETAELAKPAGMRNEPLFLPLRTPAAPGMRRVISFSPGLRAPAGSIT